MLPMYSAEPGPEADPPSTASRLTCEEPEDEHEGDEATAVPAEVLDEVGPDALVAAHLDRDERPGPPPGPPWPWRHIRYAPWGPLVCEWLSCRVCEEVRGVHLQLWKVDHLPPSYSKGPASVTAHLDSRDHKNAIRILATRVDERLH